MESSESPRDPTSQGPSEAHAGTTREASPLPLPRGEREGAADPSSPFDFRTLPGMWLRVIRSPQHGLPAVHRPGQTALFQGFVLGLGTAILVPFLQWMAYKIGGSFDPGFLGSIKAVLGAGLYLVAGTLMSMLLRATAGRVKDIDWIDDLYAFGGSMTFVLAGTVFGGMLYAIGGPFFARLGSALSVIGVVWSCFAYSFCLSRLAGVAPERAVWIVAPVFALSLALGQFAQFSPILMAPETLGG